MLSFWQFSNYKAPFDKKQIENFRQTVEKGSPSPKTSFKIEVKNIERKCMVFSLGFPVVYDSCISFPSSHPK